MSLWSQKQITFVDSTVEHVVDERSQISESILDYSYFNSLLTLLSNDEKRTICVMMKCTSVWIVCHWHRNWIIVFEICNRNVWGCERQSRHCQWLYSIAWDVLFLDREDLSLPWLAGSQNQSDYHDHWYDGKKWDNNRPATAKHCFVALLLKLCHSFSSASIGSRVVTLLERQMTWFMVSTVVVSYRCFVVNLCCK